MDLSLNLIFIGFSFLSGMLGYIILFVWIRPIVRYRNMKKQMGKDLKPFTENDMTAAKKYVDGIDDWYERNDSYAKSLSDFTKELPFWYRIRLSHRKESLTDASAQFSKIAETTKLDKIQKSAHIIKEALQLP